MNDAMLGKLTTQDTVLLVVDLQERLLPAISGAESIEQAACRLIKAAAVLGLPTLVTEQYPAGLGQTVPAVREALGQVSAFEKTLFSACVEAVQQRLAQLKPRAVLVVGVETHVCVQQTVLDLLRAGYLPYVCADAVGSRRPMDCEIALQRMRQAGAIVTSTESVIFELLGRAGTDAFKQVLKIIK